MASTIHVIIHGHFYQPPRENPWTGSIEIQDSAAPYHDWNERVTAECYTPNGRSRVLDERGRVKDVVNNYRHLSFNIGPTLLSYLEVAHPESYQRILTADRLSLQDRGRGNAMAQAYNHPILTLMSARDRQTQILWGLHDFRARFGREAEGLWLPETAANHLVMDDVARLGVRFVLLAPTQAEAIRPLAGGAWQELGPGGPPTHRAYQVRTPHGPVAVLFFHEQISRAVAFEHLLRNAGVYADRIEGIGRAAPEAEGDRLVLVATDGESYGHHEPMGDMCLAYLATRELPRRGLKLTNPATFLDAHPPAWEVRLKPGHLGLGTAWSCAHGVGRWREDCGCTTGGPASWHQGWRAPLRAAFDALRERTDALYELQAGALFRDPWKARDEYVQVLAGRKLGAARRFFERHAPRVLTDEERAQAYRLLEMQLHGMLMYTSCGWFFSDLSGLEAVQNLRYYTRAAQLAELLAGSPQDAEARRLLGVARSNLAAMGSGLDLLRRAVEPSMLSPARAAAHLGALALMDPRQPAARLHAFRVEAHSAERASQAGVELFLGRLTVLTDRTREGGTFEVLALANRELKLRALVRAWDPAARPLALEEALAEVERAGLEAAAERLAGRFELTLGLPDMLQDLRLRAVGTLLRPVLAELTRTLDGLYQQNEGLLRTLVPLGLALPSALRPAVGYAANRRFNELFARALETGDFDPPRRQAEMLQALGLALGLESSGRRLGRHLSERLEAMLRKAAPAVAAEVTALLSAAREMQVPFDEASLQDRLAERLGRTLDELLRAGHFEAAEALVELAGHLNLNTDESRARLATARAGRGEAEP
jgi:alpha-amylase/alpha-mannosidase (GH57 family)